MKSDVIVIGAGLAGLTAARALMLAGANVVVLEARGRAGGRVMQKDLADGRRVQLGGEVVGPHHTAYRELVNDLGFTLESSFTHLSGSDTYILDDGVHIQDDLGWLSQEDRSIYRHCEEAFSKLAATVDPEDPWAHANAEALDRVSVADWLRSVGATPNVVRARRLAMGALAAEAPGRTSLLADLRKEATAPSPRFYDYETWESERVAEGSASVPLRLAEQLGHRIHFDSPAVSVDVANDGCLVVTQSGETFRSDAVISALPVGPIRDVRVEGVSRERLKSLNAQTHARVSKVVYVYPTSFWEASSQNGSSYLETGLIGGTWTQRDGILSALVPPERHAMFEATPSHRLTARLEQDVAKVFGYQPVEHIFVKRWAEDPWTQGYITAWRPGDVMEVGPLHGTHEPPFYVCGSDQWVCGYMEGAVRTGRDAAAAVLRQGGY
ncbi:MAG: NAD(P)/FAD-dependent oxidoreductase [Homoserinimonas sp.]